MFLKYDILTIELFCHVKTEETYQIHPKFKKNSKKKKNNGLHSGIESTRVDSSDVPKARGLSESEETLDDVSFPSEHTRFEFEPSLKRHSSMTFLVH